jgi:taurine dioxygenase
MLYDDFPRHAYRRWIAAKHRKFYLAPDNGGLCAICSQTRFPRESYDAVHSKTMEPLVVPTGRGLGAEIRGVDLRRLGEAAFAAIQRAWLDNLVLLFRGQQLTDAELIAFSRRFGELDLAPVQESGRRFVEGMPEIYIVSNVLKDGEPIGSLGYGEAVWHTDMSYLPDPPMASMLYALEVPPAGGNTGFVNMYAVYEALPADLKRRIGGLRSSTTALITVADMFGRALRRATIRANRRASFHPLVCTHPETGRRMLYLGRRRNAYIEHFELAESEALLDTLWSYTDRPEFAWHTVWQVGDLVLWDNRCTMHRRDPFDAAARRVMHRTQIKGQGTPFGMNPVDSVALGAARGACFVSACPARC